VEVRAPQGTVRIDRSTRAMVTRSVVGLNSGKGTIDVHGDLGTVPPRLAGCTSGR
jgi:hypothetical protein